MFVERGNVAVLQCGVPASVRDSVEVSEDNFKMMDTVEINLMMRRAGLSNGN